MLSGTTPPAMGSDHPGSAPRLAWLPLAIPNITFTRGNLALGRWPYQPPPVSRCLSARLCRLHSRDPLLHVPRQVRRDAEHPFCHHQLPAVMHLVFLGRDQHFEPRFHPRLHSFRVLDLLSQKGLGGTFQNLGVLLALGAQQFQYLCLCARRLHFRPACPQTSCPFPTSTQNPVPTTPKLSPNQSSPRSCRLQ